ncbi:MAG: hypothetical protein HQL50_13370 [Magnetococcales bacterium]|nr:hypothetical protein [Magnetococcales bacterium]
MNWKVNHFATSGATMGAVLTLALCMLLATPAQATMSSGLPEMQYWGQVNNSLELDVQARELARRINDMRDDYGEKLVELSSAKDRYYQLTRQVEKSERALKMKREPILRARANYERVHELSLDDPTLSTDRERIKYMQTKNDLKEIVQDHAEKLRTLRDRHSEARESIARIMDELRVLSRDAEVMHANLRKLRSVNFLRTTAE